MLPSRKAYPTQEMTRQKRWDSNIGIELTPNGVRELPSVHDYVFRYLDLLKNTEPLPWLYNEQALVAEMAFRFQEKSRPTGFVYQMAPRLNHFPAEDLLAAPSSLETDGRSRHRIADARGTISFHTQAEARGTA